MYLMKCALWIMLAMTVAAAQLQKTPTIRLSAGRVRGLVTPDGMRGNYHSYLGIPYARVEKRFQAAKPVEPWKGVFEANNDTVRCSQIDFPPLFLIQENTGVVNREDCLNLNVYTPLPQPGAALKPVMVFIFGGGFWYGSTSSRIYGPEYFLRNDVIIVSINYRLDVLGFLCLGIKEAPGNIGMKDQVEALKWVKNNIEAFGGDPDNITLFGESAGSAAVMNHLVSPMSRGLFNKAIMQSGSAENPWSFQHEPLKIASQLVKQMGHDTEDPRQIYKIFMNMTATELLSYRVPRPIGDIVLSTTVFVPCVEKEIAGITPFLTDTPYNLIANEKYAKIPMIIGYNDHEGYLFAGNEDAASLANVTFYYSLPRDLLFPTKEERQQTADKVRELYFGNKEISVDTMVELAEYEGDSGLTYPVLATAELITRTNDKDTFMYKFAYSGFLNLMKYTSGYDSAPGATHGDELFYLFKHNAAGDNALLESGIINRMTAMWTNFAKFGNPTPEKTPLLPTKWLPTSANNPSVFVIDRNFSTSPLWASDRLLFWNETYTHYRRCV